MKYNCWKSLDEVPKNILQWLNKVCEKNKNRGVCLCYVFDVADNEVYLYTFKKGFEKKFGEELKLIYSFNVKKDGLIDLLKNNKFILYKDLLSRNDETRELRKEYYFFNHLGIMGVAPKTLIYNNLELLKDTIYKNTNIWKVLDELNNDDIRIFNITSLPLTYSKYGYYISNKQYDLVFGAYLQDGLLSEK